MNKLQSFFAALGGCILMITALASPAAAQSLELLNRYPLDADATDVVGSVDGALVSLDATPGGVFEDGGVTLSGNGYIELQEFLFGNIWYGGDVDNLPPVTLEMFGSWAGGDPNQRLFDFGDNDLEDPFHPPVGSGQAGRTYLAATPADSTGNLHFEIAADPADGGDPATVGAISAAGLNANQDFHVAVVIDPATGTARMYRNGVPTGTGTLPDSLRQGVVDGVAVVDWNNWLGRSQTDGNPLFNGRITEFRIWLGAMNDSQARQNYNCGPDHPTGCSVGPTPTLAVGQAGPNLEISWPADALGFNLHVRNDLGGGSSWSPATDEPLTSDGVRTTTIPIAEPAAYFQLQTDN